MNAVVSSYGIERAGVYGPFKEMLTESESRMLLHDVVFFWDYYSVFLRGR